MVDISQKQHTHREATAMCRIEMNANTLQKIQENQIQKGDVLTVAKIAGINGAKQTGYMIPLCHPLLLTKVSVDLEIKNDHVEIQCTVKNYGQTGVEVEAMMGVTLAAMTVYDMCKAIDKRIKIKDVQLLEKKGGRSGHFIL